MDRTRKIGLGSPNWSLCLLKSLHEHISYLKKRKGTMKDLTLYDGTYYGGKRAGPVIVQLGTRPKANTKRGGGVKGLRRNFGSNHFVFHPNHLILEYSGRNGS